MKINNLICRVFGHKWFCYAEESGFLLHYICERCMKTDRKVGTPNHINCRCSGCRETDREEDDLSKIYKRIEKKIDEVSAKQIAINSNYCPMCANANGKMHPLKDGECSVCGWSIHDYSHTDGGDCGEHTF